MGFYSKYIYPKIIETALSISSVMKNRKEVLLNVKGNILEIGFGTGLNITCYPSFVKEITVLETNEGMDSLVRIRDSKIKINFKLLNAESLPFDDETFDTVVSTFTFCSIEDIDTAMKEFLRVLKPKGQLIFLEHGAGKDNKVRFIQNLLNPIYKLLSNGCNLNRNIKSIIERSGFSIIDVEEFHDRHMIKLTGYLYTGIAIKK